MKNPNRPDWEALARLPEFQELLRVKRRFVIPASVFFLAVYMSLPVLVGYFPGFMDRKVLGDVNLAYLWAFAQFVMTFTLAWLYMRAARRWDARVNELLAVVAPEPTAA